jgi:hypothetical protein
VASLSGPCFYELSFRELWDLRRNSSMTENHADIIDRMSDYAQNFLEKPHPTFGDLPVCPFAEAARCNHKIDYQVYEFTYPQDLEPDSDLIKLIQEFKQLGNYDVLWIIHPIPLALSLDDIQQFVNELNAAIAALGLVAFNGHPSEPFNIQGVYTRHEPYLNFTVQVYEKVQVASRQLSKTRYYENWSPENLQAIGFPRAAPENCVAQGASSDEC